MSFTKKEISLLKKLNTPAKVQDFLNSIPFNFEKNKIDTIKSPIRTLRENNAHCFEGALLGAYILSLHSYEPLLLYLQSTKNKKDYDSDHVIAPFKENGYWGALSKTNHGVLRYREPIYRDIRELVMSYFHEYFLNNGTKTLRKYSEILNLNKIKTDWINYEKDLWMIDRELNKSKHFNILPNKIKNLRKADKIEIEMGKITEYKN
ncbi:MAG: hypothetical protein NTW62_03075 [Candidatus Nomurabacteria bacterium]|nr:hypothetical protein [Candidatus Nomurabacteria bacterium]